jgi:hypothetical protein
MKKLFFTCIVGMLFFASSLLAQISYWPKEIPLKTGGKILIYQPQPDELNGNILKGRSAVGEKKRRMIPWCTAPFFLMPR